MYYETPYYLSPQKGGQKVYSLLRQALQSTGKVALGTFVMRGRQHLCVIVPNGEVLMLITLRFANEVLTPALVKDAVDSGKDKKATPAEIAMAKKLVEQMSGPFRPAAFKDTYRADLMRRIQEKIRTKQTHALAVESATAERPKAQVIDLMEALRASLRKKGAQARAAPRKSSKAGKRA
jgi:DNA end-binding protein Ku